MKWIWYDTSYGTVIILCCLCEPIRGLRNVSWQHFLSWRRGGCCPSSQVAPLILILYQDTTTIKQIQRSKVKNKVIKKIHFTNFWYRKCPRKSFTGRTTSLCQRTTCGHSSTFIPGGMYGFSIILVWLSPSDLWLYLRERPFYPWLLMAYKKITSPSKCPLLIAFQSCLGAVWVWSLVDHECVRTLMRVWWFGPRLRGAARLS